MLIRKLSALLLCLFMGIMSLTPCMAEEDNTMFTIYMYDRDDQGQLVVRTVCVDDEPVDAVYGIRWDRSTQTMTLNNAWYPKATFNITFDSSTDGNKWLNVIMEGTSRFAWIRGNAPTIFAGSGTLSAGSMEYLRMELRSGKLEVDSAYAYGAANSAALYNANLTEPEYLNTYRFLGGTVDIRGSFSTGIDVTHGDIMFADTSVNINLGEKGKTGINCGYPDQSGYYGGDLKILDSDITIKLSRSFDSLMNFRAFTDVNQNLHYYTGKDKSEKKLTFGETFILSKSGNNETYTRSAKDFPDQNYLFITDRNLFADVSDSSKYYFDPVYWAFNHNPQITIGTSETTFSPDENCTRGQIVTFLYRAAGEPQVSGEMPFDDVKKGKFYYNAVLWALQNGITTGTGEHTFSPGEYCTRGQIVTFLYRYKGQPYAKETSVFKDVKPKDYFAKAVSWAAAAKVTTGTSADTFSPYAYCTRGQAVTFLYRAMEEN